MYSLHLESAPLRFSDTSHSASFTNHCSGMPSQKTASTRSVHGHSVTDERSMVAERGYEQSRSPAEILSVEMTPRSPPLNVANSP